MPHNICSMCNGSVLALTYAKQVDPSVQKYGTILGDAPQQGESRKKPGTKMHFKEVCLPAVQNPQPKTARESTVTQTPCDTVKRCPKFVCQPCPPPPPNKVWLTKSSPIPQSAGLNRLLMCLLSFAVALHPLCSLLGNKTITTPCKTNLGTSSKDTESFFLPVGGTFGQESSSSGSCKPIMVCLPCVPSVEKPVVEKKVEELKPIGLVTKNQDMDFIGGKIISGCTCGRRNGLGGTDCPRISCQNNPGCSMIPPMCWPQFKKPPSPPPPLPDQKMICVPIELVYYEPSESS